MPPVEKSPESFPDQKPLPWFERVLRRLDLWAAPKPGDVLRLRVGAWNPEASQDTSHITLHRIRPDWRAIRRDEYQPFDKLKLPAFWTVVERVWDYDSRKVFIKVVSHGNENIVGWCQWLEYHFRIVDLDEKEKETGKDAPQVQAR